MAAARSGQIQSCRRNSPTPSDRLRVMRVLLVVRRMIFESVSKAEFGGQRSEVRGQRRDGGDKESQCARAYRIVAVEKRMSSGWIVFEGFLLPPAEHYTNAR